MASSGSTSEFTEEAGPPRYEGLGFGLGFALGAAFCWLIPHLLNAGHGWVIVGQVAAWVLFTVAATGSLFEVENVTGRKGFSSLGAAVVIASAGAGVLALGTRLLSGMGGAVFSVLGVSLVVFACVGVGMGVGEIASGRPKARRRTRSAVAENGPTQRPGFTRAEAWTIGLAVVQVLLGAIALFR